MRRSLINRSILNGALALLAVALVQCQSGTTSSGWQKKNDELIEQYKLTKRELTGVPQNGIASNLEEGKVKSTSTVDSAELYPGVKAKLFWGTGLMSAVITLDANAKV